MYVYEISELGFLVHQVYQFCRDETIESAERVIGAAHHLGMTKSRQRRAIRAFKAERRRRQEQDRRRSTREEEAWVSFESSPPPPAPAPPAPKPAARMSVDDVMPSGHRVPGQSVDCGWCGEPIPLRVTGRLPKWCSRTCRQRAWEAAKFAERHDRPVQVVTRYLRAVPDTPVDWVVQIDHLIRQLKANDGGEWCLQRDVLTAKLLEAAELSAEMPSRKRRTTGWDY